MGVAWKWPAVGAGGGGGGGVQHVPTLQPNLYGATAQWGVLLDHTHVPAVMSGTDRSGNGYHLSDTNVSSQPSNIPSAARYCSPVRGGGMGPAVAVPPVNLGARTLTMVANFGSGITSTQWLFVQANFSVTGGAGNCSFGITADGGKLNYFAQNGAGTGVVVPTALPVPVDGLDHFLSIARAADGVTLEFGLDGAYDTQVAPLPPTLGSVGKPFIGCRAVPANLALEIFLGGLQDVCDWPLTLTQAQVAPLRAAAMGL